jgi:hypothetical protein
MRIRFGGGEHYNKYTEQKLVLYNQHRGQGKMSLNPTDEQIFMLNINEPIMKWAKMFIQHASLSLTHARARVKNYLKSHIQTSMRQEHSTHNIYKI